MSEERITPGEADRIIEEHYARIRELWSAAYSIAVEIAEGRGFANPVIEFSVWEHEGERCFVTVEDEFFCQVDRELVSVASPGYGESEDEREFWARLNAPVEQLNDLRFPPGLHETAARPEDLFGDEDDLRMVLFADFDGDDCFQYDERGMKTVIEGVWY